MDLFEKTGGTIPNGSRNQEADRAEAIHSSRNPIEVVPHPFGGSARLAYRFILVFDFISSRSSSSLWLRPETVRDHHIFVQCPPWQLAFPLCMKERSRFLPSHPRQVLQE